MRKMPEIKRLAARHARSIEACMKIYAAFHVAWIKADKSKIDVFDEEGKSRIFGIVLSLYQHLGTHDTDMNQFITSTLRDMEFAENEGNSQMNF